LARSEAWPVPDSLFQNGAVCLSDVAAKWFRYYLVDYIHWKRGELEAKEGVLQLAEGFADSSYDFDPRRANDRGVPHRHGNLTNPRSGRSVAVDLTLAALPVDIGRLSLDGVNEGRPGLFEDLSKRDRPLLYCVFIRASPLLSQVNRKTMLQADSEKRHGNQTQAVALRQSSASSTGGVSLLNCQRSLRLLIQESSC
jgi:hypothetical protein